MQDNFWTIVGWVVGVVFVCGVFAYSCDRRAECEARGGVWLGREWLCVKGERIRLP